MLIFLLFLLDVVVDLCVPGEAGPWLLVSTLIRYENND